MSDILIFHYGEQIFPIKPQTSVDPPPNTLSMFSCNSLSLHLALMLHSLLVRTAALTSVETKLLLKPELNMYQGLSN
ncbi:hypothetical protein J6590_090396 [Homalodisca vitripennis]|nr:hypothetical protein J6590_090396 [Homalodisca vitripennis]